MKHGILRTLIAAVLCACLVFSMASCSVLESLGILGKDPEDPACEHRDADDNSLCDECGEEYTDGKDLPDEPVCQHRDADDNNLCDKCGEAFEDGKDVADEPECTHRDADDNNLCDSCGEEYDDGKDLPDEPACEHRDADDNSLCDSCGEEYDDGTEGIQYTLSSDESYYIVTGYTGTATDVIITCTYNGKPVKEIGERAFYNCDSLTSVTIPDSVASIGDKAFASCDSLTSVTIGNGVKSIGDEAFYNCDSLTSVTIGNGVKSIGDEAFWRCTRLEEVYFNATNMLDLSWDNRIFNDAGNSGNGIKLVIGKDVTRIPAYLFYHYSSDTAAKITSIEFEEGSLCKRIGNYAFYDCDSLTSVTIPDSVESIGEGAFYNCDNLIEEGGGGVHYVDKWAIGRSWTGSGRSVYLRGDTVGISDSAFYWCSQLNNVTIPDSVKSIGSYAFYKCTGLTSVTIPGNVKNIGSYAFWNCENLTSVTIPDSVESIGSYAFDGCYDLTSVTIGNGVKSIGFGAFVAYTRLMSITVAIDNPNYKDIDGNLYTKDGKTLIQYARGKTDTSFVIPDGVESIGSYAFYGCRTLTSVTIPDSVTSIGDMAFTSCDGLTSVTIPSSVVSIGNNAFSICTGLTSVTIGSGVKSIGEWAFSSCDGLTSVTIPDSVTSIGERAFSSCDSLTSVTIPSSVVSIGNNAFSRCTSLTSITVAIDNSNYKDIDGNLYSKDGKTLIQYAVGKTDTSFVTPDGVTSISPGAFSDCYSLTSVTIPDSVESIGVQAFYGCNNLIEKEGGVHYVDKWVVGCDASVTSVTLRSDTVGISDSAFSSCRSLTSISVAADNPNYKDIGGNLYTKDGKTLIQYALGKTATSFVIPSGVESIGNYAFSSCTSLTSVTIPDSVKIIGSSAFSSCTSLRSVTIPDSVTSIGEGAFRGCTSLANITVAAGNTNYKGIDGNLYTKDGKTLIQYAVGQEYASFVIPDGVESIGSYAFLGCDSLRSVTIGNGVVSIGDYAFSNCDSLRSVSFANADGWSAGATSLSAADLANTTTAAAYLYNTYVCYTWTRK